MTACVHVLLSPAGPPVPTVCTADISVLKYEAKRSGQCNWGIIPEVYFPSGYGLVLPKNTPFKIHIDVA